MLRRIDFYRRRSRKVNMSPEGLSFGFGAEDPVLLFTIATFIWGQRIGRSSVPERLGAEDPIKF